MCLCSAIQKTMSQKSLSIRKKNDDKEFVERMIETYLIAKKRSKMTLKFMNSKINFTEFLIWFFNDFDKNLNILLKKKNIENIKF